MSDLTSQKCVPCQGGVAPMNEDEISKYLPIVPGWELEEGLPAGRQGKLVRGFEFKDFKEAIAFVNKVADIAEGQQHHPNILVFGWNKVKLTLFTHKIKGLHINDFILAAKISSLI